MNASLNALGEKFIKGEPGNYSGGRYIELQGQSKAAILVLPEISGSGMSVPLPSGTKTARMIDLGTGVIRQLQAGADAQAILAFDKLNRAPIFLLCE